MPLRWAQQLAALLPAEHGGFTSACKAMVEAGEIIQVNPQRREFLERKYRVYLTLWEQQQAVNQLMQ